MPTPVVWTVLLDLDRNQAYETDITAWVATQTINVKRGLTSDGKARISTMSFQVNNRTGMFTQGNPNNLFGGSILLPIPVLLHSTGGVQQYIGLIRRITPSWGATPNLCNIECTDILEDAQRSDINVAVDTTAVTSVSSLDAIAAAWGIPTNWKYFGAAIGAYPFHGVATQNVLAAMEDVSASEMGGNLSVGKDGVIRQSARNYRLSLGGINHTWGDGTVLTPQTIKFDNSDRELVTDVDLTTNVYSTETKIVDADYPLVSFLISALATYYLTIDFGRPIEDVVSPVAVADYLANTTSDGLGTDKTANLSIGYTFTVGETTVNYELTNNSPTDQHYVTKFRAHVVVKPIVYTDASVPRLIPAYTYVFVDVNFGKLVESVAAPLAVHDYTANTLANGTGADRTANLISTVADLVGGVARQTLYNNSATSLYVTKNELRGVAWQSKSIKTAASKALPTFITGRRKLSINVPFVGDSQLFKDYARQLLRTYRYPYPVLRLGFVGLGNAANDATIRADLLSANLNNFVRYKDTALGVRGSYSDDWYYIESLDLTIPPKQAFRIEVAMTPSYMFRNLSEIVYDDFLVDQTGTLALATSGDDWVDDTNMNVATTNGGATAGSDAETIPIVLIGVDQVVEGTFQYQVGDEEGLVFRSNGSGSYYYYRAYVDKGDNKIHLEKSVAGVITDVATAVAFTVGTSHEMRAMIRGSRIQVWVDFKLYFDVVDANITAGNYCGLFLRNAQSSRVRDFYAQSL